MVNFQSERLVIHKSLEAVNRILKYRKGYFEYLI